MKKIVILTLVLSSVSAFSQSTKAQRAVVPESAQIVKDKKAGDAPCADTKEDVLKKLEEKSKLRQN